MVLNGSNSCEQVDKGVYSPNLNNCSTGCPANSTSPEGSDGINDCKCNAGYGTNAACSDLNGSNSCVQVNIGQYSPAANNCVNDCSLFRANTNA